MRTYDEIFEAAREGSPFSNSTEGMSWQWNWCDRCVNDKAMRVDDGRPDPVSGVLGCPILGVAMLGKTPSEWIENDWRRLGDQYHCVEFRDEDDGPSPEPQPLPDPPGMEALLPREPYTAALMFTANTIQPAEVAP